MWIEFLQTLILAQTQQEKEMTYYGLIFFGFFLFVLVLDSLSKGRIIPSKGPMKKILIYFLIVVAVVIILLKFIYK